MNRFDVYILFLFAAQIYIYFTKSISTNFYIDDLFSSGNILSQIAFFLYSISFFLIFFNFYNLFLAYKKDNQEEKQGFISRAFLGTIFFFIMNFGFEILFLYLKKPLP